MTTVVRTSADDVPQVPGADPLWSENYFFSGYDPDHGVGLVSHVSTVPGSPQVWQGVLTIYLPEGDLLVVKSSGRADGPMRAGPDGLRLTCVEPGEHWRMGIDAMARRVPQGVAAAGLVTDGPAEPVRGELDFTAQGPAWNLRPATLETQDWGDVHLQQSCRVAGTLRVADAEIPMGGPGFRDHTSGPRDVTPYRGDTWAHATFPSGMSFMGLDTRGGPDEAQAFRVGYVCRDGVLRDAVPKPMPRPRSLSDSMAPLVVELDTATEILTIEVEPLAVMGFTIVAPQQWCLGVDVHPGRDELLSINAPARFRCNGEIGHGHFERMIRATDYVVPVPG